MGCLVRRDAPDQRGRRHDRDPWRGGRPGRPPRPPPEGARRRPAVDLGRRRPPAVPRSTPTQAPEGAQRPTQEIAMTPTPQVPPARTATTTSVRRSALVGGLAYLITFAASIPAVLLL